MKTLTCAAATKLTPSPQVKQDNQDLRELLWRAERMSHLARPWPEMSHRTARLLTKLRDLLILHFALEEDLGFFKGAEDDALPNKAERAAEYIEHVALLLEICAISGQARRIAREGRPDGELGKLMLRLRAFLDQLFAHEDREAAHG